MGALQLLRFAVGGLWRQKVRTGLTLIGVTVGTCALAFSVALGLGLRAFIDREFQGRETFWRISVRVTEPTADPADLPPEKVEVHGTMSDERRARIRDALAQKYLNEGSRKPPKTLTSDALAAIAALPDVSEVRTVRSDSGRAWLGDRSATGFVVAGKLAPLADRLIVGRLPESDDAPEVVVSEFTLYELGVRDDAQLEAVLGKPLQVDIGGVRNAPPMALAMALTGRALSDDLSRAQALALAKLSGQLPKALDKFDLTAGDRAALKLLLEKKPEADSTRRIDSTKVASGEFRIAGVTRLLTKADRKTRDPFRAYEYDHGDLFLPPAAGDHLFRQLPWAKDMGFFSAEVRVRPGGDLPAVVNEIDAMGFDTSSALKWFDSAKREVTLIAAGLNLFAFVALFVAGIGITNTLVTSVVERTREIGILKAVGATRGQVFGIFLTEGAVIGLLGSGLGLALARLLVIPADGYVRGLIQGQMYDTKMLSETVFEFPWWLWAGAVVFAVGVTTAAAFYPARRAARIDPILALKYE
jgi:putative ABC transport system permease protein